MPPTLRQKVVSCDIRVWNHFLRFADFCLRKGLLTGESLIKNRKANLRSEKMLSLISYNYLPLVFFTAFFSLLRISTAQVLEFRIVPDTNLPILDSSGSTIRTNLSLQLGTFTNSTNAVQVLSLIGSQTNQSQIAALMVSNYYSIFTTNQWTNPVPLRVPNLSIPTNISIGGTNLSTNIPIYIMIFNNTNPANATEMGIFRARSTSTNNQTNAFFPSSTNGRIVLSGGDGTNTTNTALKLGVGVLFGQTINGQLRLAPIGPPNQILTTNLVAFQGLTSSLQLKANNGPTSFSVLVSNGGDLSTLGLTNSNGVIVGEPRNDAIGTNTLVVTATNADGFAGSVTTNVSLIVKAQNGPNFTNASRFTNIAGISNSFTFLTDALDPSALQFTALDSLPTDSTLSTSGVLTMSNTSAGTNLFRILVTDTSSGDVRALNFTNVTILPSIFIEGTNSSGELELVADKPFTNRITYTPGYLPTNITSSPDGTFRNLTVTTNSGNYYLSGTSRPTVMRTNDSPETNTISASGNRVSAQLKLPIVFVNAAPALVTNRYTWILGETTNQIVEATGSPTFSASDLPVVVTGNISTNGLITVTTNPAVLTNVTRGVWTSTIVMNNLGGAFRGGGRTTSSVVITLTNPIPSITSTNRLLLAAGKSATYTLTASGNPAVVEFLNPENFPPGMSANGNILSGIPTQQGPSPSIQCRAYNYGTPGDTSNYQPAAAFTLNLFVATSRPTNPSYSSPDNLVVGNPLPSDGSPFIDVSSGIQVAAYGLPTGLSLDRTSGKLLGTPTTTGTYNATVFFQNGKGWVKKNVTLTVR
jgi:hypothetical protein